jgi:hypothetical protein
MRPNPRRFDVYAVVAFAVLYVVRSAWLLRFVTTLPPDSIEYAATARSLVSGAGYTINLIEIHPGFLPAIRHLHELHGLLQPVLLAALFWIDGVQLSLAHLPGLFFLGTTWVLTLLIAEQAFGGAAGLLAAAMLIARSDLTVHAPFGGDDIGSMCFSAAAFLGLLKARDAEHAESWLTFAGVSSAVCVLEKFSGVVLPVVFLVISFTLPKRTLRGVGAWLRLFLPTTLAVLLYVGRNYALHRHLGFRFGAIDWLSKDGFGNYFAFYERAPSLSTVLSGLGASRVFQLIGHQCQSLWQLAWTLPEILVAGPVAALWLANRRHPLGPLAAAYTVALGFLVCVVYHVEGRYLFVLYPLLSAAVAGAVVLAWRLFEQRFAWARAPFWTLAAGACGALLALFGLFRAFGVYGALGATKTPAGVCDDAIAFIHGHVPGEEPILTTSPWFLNWAAERPAVMAPTNGLDANESVIRHYGVKWVLDGLPTYGGADVAPLVRPPAGERGLPVELRYTGAVCRVYRLTTPS